MTYKFLEPYRRKSHSYSNYFLLPPLNYSARRYCIQNGRWKRGAWWRV